jgi:hypothetical protein
MIEKGQLLEVASQIKLEVPTVPTWYISEYLTTHNLKQGDNERNKKIQHEIEVAWQTYHLTKCAMSLINSCQAYEESVGIN